MLDVGFYGTQVLPRITNFVLDNPECNRIRRRVAAGLAGEVLEVGFGSGLNVPFYPSAVRRVRAVDPAALGQKLAATRLAVSPITVEHLPLGTGRLPLSAESVDHVLTTWTLCTIPAVEQALREFSRVLRPGGQVHFAEHGRSPDRKVARWQDRLNPLQRAWAGGCNLNRPIDHLLIGAGFEIVRLATFYTKGPKAMGYTYEGVAAKP